MLNTEKKQARKKWRGPGVLVGGSLLALTGCMGQIDTSGSKPPQTLAKADYEKKIQVIQNDPHMSQGAKAIVIGNIKAQETGQSMHGPSSPPANFGGAPHP